MQIIELDSLRAIMDCEKDNEKKSQDPGAARFGNFMNYYSFNPPENRLKFVPESLISLLSPEDPSHSSPVCVLDIGCNAGDLTHQLHERLSSQLGQKVVMLGIDLDPKLVERADKFSIPHTLEFKHLDILDGGVTQHLEKHLSDYGRIQFDLICLFSVTMWVHLNHGDQGLVELVRKVVDMARFVLVEPQPWKCYQTAARRMRKLGREEFEQMKQLKVRGPGVDLQIVELFKSEGMELIENFGETKWNRKLVLLKNTNCTFTTFNP